MTARKRGEQGEGDYLPARNPYAQEPNRGDISSDGKQYYSGNGGIFRDPHTGYFSSINPYFDNLRVTNNNQDADALYERATEWEADYADYMRQRADARADLLEQREYDSPEQQIARQRAAGINPDISASGGAGSGASSGSSATVNPVSQNDVTSQTKYGNTYDNTQMIINGINSGVQVVSAFTGVATAVIDGITKMQTLPAQISLGKSQAYIADKTKDIAVAQAGETLKGTQLSNATSLINNAKNSLSMYGDIAQYLTPESTDEDYDRTFKLMQVPESMRDDLKEGVKHYFNNPSWQKGYESSKNEVNRQQSYSRVYTPALLDRLNTVQADAQVAQGLFTTSQNNFSRSLIDYLDSVDYQTTVGQNMVSEADIQKGELSNRKKVLKSETDALVGALDYMDNIKKYYQDEIDRIQQNIAKRKDKEPTPLEEALIDSYTHSISFLNTQSVQQKMSIYNSIQSLFVNRAFMQENQKKNGNIELGDRWTNRQNEALATLFHGFFNNHMSNEMFGEAIYNYIVTGVNTASTAANAISNFMPKE